MNIFMIITNKMKLYYYLFMIIMFKIEKIIHSHFIKILIFNFVNEKEKIFKII